MSRRMLPAATFRIAALALGAVTIGCTGGPDAGTGRDSGTSEAARDERPSGQVGARAPSLELHTLDGQAASLASLAGSPVLLNVWATWCHPCQDEIPVLEALHERYASRGLEIVGVSIDDGDRGNDIRSFASRFGMSYPIWHDPDQRVMAAFSVIGVPTSFLIGRNGRVLWRRTGEVKAGDPALLLAIDSALAASE